jgi:hypothetical protein
MSDNKKHGAVPNNVGSHLTELNEEDRARARLLGNEIARVYAEKVRAYQDLYKTHPDDEYIKDSYGTGAKVHAAATEPADDASYQRALKQSAERLTWDDLQSVAERNMEDAVTLWHVPLELFTVTKMFEKGPDCLFLRISLVNLFTIHLKSGSVK